MNKTLLILTLIASIAMARESNYNTGIHTSDNDKDGVLNSFDNCPKTPSGTTVDTNGCRVIEDSDHDGVLDDYDICPKTPTGVATNENGCPSS